MHPPVDRRRRFMKRFLQEFLVVVVMVMMRHGARFVMSRAVSYVLNAAVDR